MTSSSRSPQPPRLNPLHCGAVVASAACYLFFSFALSCLNPLHCGAVVASMGIPPPHGGGRGLNPLHCGAVVASRAPARDARAAPVLIPFIAGQWSLHPPATPAAAASGVLIPFIAGQWSLLPVPDWWTWDDDGSQSPSLRGSGRFLHAAGSTRGFWMSQSPSLRGSGRFLRATDCRPPAQY